MLPTELIVTVTTEDPTLLTVTSPGLPRSEVHELPVSSKLQNKESPSFLVQE